MYNSIYMIVLFICMLIRNKVNRQIQHLFVYCFCISHISLSVVFLSDTSSFTVSHLTQVMSTIGTSAFINRSMSSGYVCICQQVILFWCSRAMYTWGHLAGVHLPWVYVHFSIGYTVVVVVELCTHGVNLLGVCLHWGMSAFVNG